MIVPDERLRGGQPLGKLNRVLINNSKGPPQAVAVSSLPAAGVRDEDTRVAVMCLLKNPGVITVRPLHGAQRDVWAALRAPS